MALHVLHLKEEWYLTYIQLFCVYTHAPTMCHYALFPAMFSPLHNITDDKQYQKHFPDITENVDNFHY